MSADRDKARACAEAIKRVMMEQQVPGWLPSAATDLIAAALAAEREECALDVESLLVEIDPEASYYSANALRWAARTIRERRSAGDESRKALGEAASSDGLREGDPA